MDRETLFAEVLLPLPVKGSFTYRVPFNLNELIKVGQRVAIQFGKKKIYSGLVKSIHKNVPKNPPKYILHLLDKEPLVLPVQFRMWEWMSSYYMGAEGEVMNAALPSAFKMASESRVLLSPLFVPDHDILDEHEFRITEALLEKKRLKIGEISKLLGFENVLPYLKRMIEKKMLVMEEEIEGGFKPKKEKYIKLSEAFMGDEELQVLMDELGRRAFRQLQVLMTFITLNRTVSGKPAEVSKKELLEKASASPSILKSLVSKGVFEEYEKTVSRIDENEPMDQLPEVKLSDHQQVAFDKVREGFRNNKVVLLHGVTSGGKTELYIKLIQETIASGKQVLYLLPEIALTTQIINRLKIYFGGDVGIYHSRYGRNERAEVWYSILGVKDDNGINSSRIILGPRSAIFLPFDKLGLVIVDEEHDYSYKQFDPSPRYHARDTAIYLATLHKANVILGSATPSVESYYNAMNGKYRLVEISERYRGMKLPDIKVVNMREEQRRRMLRSHFSSVLYTAMKKALEDKKQVILFQNRRGFSLRIECEQCNFIPSCKNCDVTLTYHKRSELLKCHYCGYSTGIPAECPDCGSTSLKMKGFGTEKVEEELALLLPEAKIDRMDLDTTRTKNAYQKLIDDFENRRTDILTGTQMVTKGLDFDNVRIVGILSADNMLSFPDFRAHERSYQMMAQVSGRAGRKHEQGKVVIQAWQPDHPVIRFVVNNDYNGMYRQQIAERERFRYPPFYRLIKVRLKHKNPVLLNKAAAALSVELKNTFRQYVIGPEYPLVPRIRNFYLKEFTLKTPRNTSQALIKQKLIDCVTVFRKLGSYKAVKILFDVDPY